MEKQNKKVRKMQQEKRRKIERDVMSESSPIPPTGPFKKTLR